MKLYFLRHGLAGDYRDWEGDDDLRPLTAEGEQKMRRTAQAFKRMGLKIDRVLTSPLVRARQTAELALAGLPAGTPLQVDERLGAGFGPELLAELLAEHTEVDSLLLVGHEPGFSLAISALIGGGRVVVKKGSLARLDLDGAPADLQGELVWLIPPKAFD